MAEKVQCEEPVAGRSCKRAAKFRVQTDGGTWLLCGQHADMVVTWNENGQHVYVFDLEASR